MATKDSNNKSLVKRIYSRHLSLYRELNDIHIFVAKTVPLLADAARDGIPDDNDSDDDLSFSVPGKIGKKGVARRNPAELVSLFKRFAKSELYENLLVSMVSRFEFYLADVMKAFLESSPKKLLIGPKGGDSGKLFPVQIVLDSESMEELLDELIDQRVQAIFHADPKEYCAYFNAISELGVTQEQFGNFFEIKATRDLIVHNSLRVNDLYLKKAGSLNRGDHGDKLKVDKVYFDECVSHLKTLSSAIEKTTHSRYEKK